MFIVRRLDSGIVVSGRRGVTLLEASIVFIVMISLITGAFAFANMMIREEQARVESVRLVSLAQNVRKLKRATGYADSASLLADTVMHNLVPEGILVLDGPVLRHQWGGTISFGVQAGGGHVAFTYDNIPKSVCALMVKKIPSGQLFSVGPGSPGPSFSHGVDVLIDEAAGGAIGRICEKGKVHWSTMGPVAEIGGG